MNCDHETHVAYSKALAAVNEALHADPDRFGYGRPAIVANAEHHVERLNDALATYRAAERAVNAHFDSGTCAARESVS